MVLVTFLWPNIDESEVTPVWLTDGFDTAVDVVVVVVVVVVVRGEVVFTFE